MQLMERYSELKSLATARRAEFAAHMEHIKRDTAYLTAPASTKYQLCMEHGLLEHSVNAAEAMLKLHNALAPELSDESCMIVALLHDLSKAGTPGNLQYLIYEPTDRQKQYRYPAAAPYRFNNDMTYLSVPIRSIHLILPYLSLTRTMYRQSYTMTVIM